MSAHRRVYQLVADVVRSHSGSEELRRGMGTSSTPNLPVARFVSA
jgi:hypothetical protein